MKVVKEQKEVLRGKSSGDVMYIMAAIVNNTVRQGSPTPGPWAGTSL